MITKEEFEKICLNFGIEEPRAITPLSGGLVHQTFLVEENGNRFVLQKTHETHQATQTENVDVVTKHLNKHGFLAPLFKKGEGGTLVVRLDGQNWRLMTFVEGHSFDSITDKKQLFSAGALLGKFHNTLSDITYKFKNTPSHWHDTAFYANRLTKTATEKQPPQNTGFKNLLSEIKSELKAILPTKNVKISGVVHGDPKINNILFDKEGMEAICFLDFDLVHNGNILDELGDAARSWCNPHGEESDKAYFDVAPFEAMIDGYIASNNNIDKRKLMALPATTARIALELSARFLEDALTQKHFRLEEEKYSNLFEQNMTRSHSQFLLYKDIKTKQKEIEKLLQTKTKLL